MVARITLDGQNEAGKIPAKVVTSDTNADALKILQSGFPGVLSSLNKNRESAAQDLVFLGLHPPAPASSLSDIKDCLKPGAILISLAPKLSITKLTDGLGGFDGIMRLIPHVSIFLLWH